MSAAGLADLRRRSASVRQCLLGVATHFSTAALCVASTAPSSFTKCGRLPVLSSCWIVPTTMSSMIPSTSTLFDPSAAGDGGGDNSVTRDGFSSLNRIVVERGGLIWPDGESEPCDRFDFFTGGSSPSMMVLGGEGCDAARDLLGTVMPSSASESDLRRVFMGMLRRRWFVAWSCVLVLRCVVAGICWTVRGSTADGGVMVVRRVGMLEAVPAVDALAYAMQGTLCRSFL